ncbi:hypothetical protein [Mesorhizobium sp.]|uniref:hypothetical protein n=1 Tax=Mesorhizobium sp. TaxID=1871066 RepID=UPI0025BA27C8|nr:hypothetical protein [Mesorhizobium sp.]
MTTTGMSQAGQASPIRYIRSTIRSGGRRGPIVAGAAVVVAGLTLNWSWLVAAGIAPVLLSVLPCVAMCALGLCMNRMTACSTENVPPGEGADGSKTISTDMKGSA